MSLTYSLHQPQQALSRTAVVAFIMLLHVGAFIALNNGIGSLSRFISPPPPFKLVVVKPDPIPERPIPQPELQNARINPAPLTPLPDPGPIVLTGPREIIEAPPDELKNIPEHAADSVVPTNPKVAVLTRVDPAYPVAAEAAGQQGTVLLDVQIDVRGHVVDVSVAHSSGFSELDAAAARAVRQWRFAVLATNSHVRVPIKFQLNTQKY
jgi:TonB family protein